MIETFWGEMVQKGEGSIEIFLGVGACIFPFPWRMEIKAVRTWNIINGARNDFYMSRRRPLP